MYRKSINRRGWVRISDNASIPDDINNSDYIKVLEWLNAGNAPVVVSEVLPTLEQARSDEYLKQTDSKSHIDIILSILETIIDELDARGKTATDAFHNVLKLRNDILGKLAGKTPTTIRIPKD